MTHQQLELYLKHLLIESYPSIQIRITSAPDDSARPAIYFVEEKFRLLYPEQRFHYIAGLIPSDFFKAHLANSLWFELAPGEHPEDLVYPDAALIQEITAPVMQCLVASHFFEQLDDRMSPRKTSPAPDCCDGDYRIAKEALSACGFREDEYFDMFHVLMVQGAYCDCEILHNVAPQSRLKEEYWKSRAAQQMEFYAHHH